MIKLSRNRHRSRLVGSLALMFSVCLLSGIGAADAEDVNPSGLDESIINEAKHSIRLGLDYLESQQQDDGSWDHHPGMTALAVTAFLRDPDGLEERYLLTVDKGLDFMLSCVQPDGGIYMEELPAYNTSICLMALVEADDPEYTDIIKAARQFLIDIQTDEGEGVSPDSSFYGGIGYGGSGRPDLSNLQWSLEALKKSEKYAPRSEVSSAPTDESSPPTESFSSEGESGRGLFWDKAILFLQRCQNLEEYNDQPWSGDDGGFVYYPGYSKAGSTTSYGSMTYAGMKSLIYANLERDDPRVQAAFGWIRGNYTVDENPELGNQGLYYYYHSMAKALDAYGENVVIDTTGTRHTWRQDLVLKLVSLQDENGSWINTHPRWWENNRNLVTSYSVMALEEVMQGARRDSAD
jgi:squalene-hopene/tetraprenyl-beta-curcumene cyclase